MVDLNEQSLTDMMSRLKTQQEPIKLKPRNIFVPRDTVQQVADEHGITFDEAKLLLTAYAQRLMETTKTKTYPAWICSDCGRKYGRRECGISTWHEDTCGVCGEQGMVTEPRDFGHLKEGWQKEAAK